MKKKKIYPIKLQKKILQEAIKLIKKRYNKNSSILAIYLGGSIVDGTFGEYDESVHQDGVPRVGSDIDIMIITKERPKFLLTEEEQKTHGLRHIGKNQDIPVYRLVEEGKDIFLHEKHPIEPMIVAKSILELWLSGQSKWENMREKYVR